LIQAATRSNVSKYANPNPLHQWLLRHFLEKAASETRWALGALATPALLDVGCGEGYVLRHLQRDWPTLETQGMDGDREALALARRACPGTLFLQADAARLPFRDRSFDMLTCLEVLEHLREPGQALAELARVSRRYILLSVPNQPFFALSNLLRGRNLGRLGEDRDHIHHWTASQFLSLVRAKLDVIKLCYPFPWVLVLAETRFQNG